MRVAWQGALTCHAGDSGSVPIRQCKTPFMGSSLDTQVLLEQLLLVAQKKKDFHSQTTAMSGSGGVPDRQSECGTQMKSSSFFLVQHSHLVCHTDGKSSVSHSRSNGLSGGDMSRLAVMTVVFQEEPGPNM